MPFELGGRADKQGNTYEHNCAIYAMLKILDEVGYSVVIEALGDDEKGTYILVATMKGLKSLSTKGAVRVLCQLESFYSGVKKY